MARVLGLEAMRMADADVLPYDYVAYAREISAYIEAAKPEPPMPASARSTLLPPRRPPRAFPPRPNAPSPASPRLPAIWPG